MMWNMTYQAMVYLNLNAKGGKVSVNAHLISSIRENGSRDEYKSSICVGGEIINVRETREQVLAMMLERMNSAFGMDK